MTLDSGAKAFFETSTSAVRKYGYHTVSDALIPAAAVLRKVINYTQQLLRKAVESSLCLSHHLKQHLLEQYQLNTFRHRWNSCATSFIHSINFATYVLYFEIYQAERSNLAFREISPLVTSLRPRLLLHVPDLQT
ncbi:hypothetical protein CUMW_118810 [Citrus unshiu]|nr:hypothetical protein CUMW_118810 [Citrus unshiu]